MDAASAILTVALARLPCEHPAWLAEYEEVLVESIESYWPASAHVLKCMFIAELMAESGVRLDPRALSPAGARGLAQVMPTTWAEVTRRIGVACSPYDPECSIRVGAAYFGQLLRIYTSPRAVLDLGCWAATSFNSGPGNMLKAQVVGRTEVCEEGLEALPQVTGRHAKETQGYWKRIKRYLVALYSGRRLS